MKTVYGFKHIYQLFPCFFNRNLPLFLYNGEKEAREEGLKEFNNVSVQLSHIQKIGFKTYLAVWRLDFDMNNRRMSHE